MTRRQAIAELLSRARADNRPAWYLDGPRPTEVKKGQIPDKAVYACVSGDTEWTVLPYEDPKPF
jgi:hypothetical protein